MIVYVVREFDGRASWISRIYSNRAEAVEYASVYADELFACRNAFNDEELKLFRNEIGEAVCWDYGYTDLNSEPLVSVVGFDLYGSPLTSLAEAAV